MAYQFVTFSILAASDVVYHDLFARTLPFLSCRVRVSPYYDSNRVKQKIHYSNLLPITLKWCIGIFSEMKNLQESSKFLTLSIEAVTKLFLEESGLSYKSLNKLSDLTRYTKLKILNYDGNELTELSNIIQFNNVSLLSLNVSLNYIIT